jgi:hypothetical protein
MALAQKTNILQKKLSGIDAIFVALLLTVFGGIVLHAPLTVGFGVLLPDYDLLIKAWKEILMGVALALGLFIVARQKAWHHFNTPIFWLIGGFAALNLLLIPVFFNGFEAAVAGLFINLRYLLFFVLVYVALVLYPGLYKTFFKTFIIGAVIVIGFAVLQLTVLPHDVLKYIGYSTETIVPYLTVDQNMDYIRINSTLRGPNPLGAYAMIVITMLVALWLRGPRRLTKREFWLTLLLGIGSAVTVWASYARSAALAVVVSVGIVLFVVFKGRISRAVWIGLALVVLLLTGSIIALKDTQFVSQVILHEDPLEGNDINSNDGHAESLVTGALRTIQQPFGAGVGSTGSASLLGDAPFIVENQYFFIAHEVGWLGLVLFVIIFWYVLRQLWRKRSHWFALGAFASGVGLAVIGIILPVFVDDTVSIVWWGLAAVALATDLRINTKKRVSNQKGTQ